ncbi:uncharacterized protein Dwil_GK10720 [Drosophila willistoni]|uniref:Methylosome subunit pICln n=1 Tax=Drosophila willistoni TaxID=7260 RepID=B4MIS2_DROWI|nr:methylosome subunit pICln [Drosophila willistoni]EDW72011.1 uncharacterized protein Dwil_GK10720 [Drosophila willistoni]
MVIITPVSAPEHGLLYTANNIKLKLGEKIVGDGTVYIAQNSLSWQPSDLPDGISINWTEVSLHGISSNPRKCIYFMLDNKVEWDGVYGSGQNGNENGIGEPQSRDDVDEGNESDEDDDGVDNFEDALDNEQFDAVTECWLLPDDIHSVDTMYRAMTTCQALHPDSADSDLSEDSDAMQDAGGMAYDDQDMAGDALTLGQNDGEVGGMQNLSLDDDDERFEDADE